MKKFYKKENSWKFSPWIFVCLLIYSSTVFGQTKTITGSINDINGDVVPGVTVSVKGTPKIGTVSDANGKFSLAGVDSKMVLRVTSIGFETQEILIGNKIKIDIVLKLDNEALEEVVVIGYGTQKKSSLTGAVSKYKNERMDEAPVTRID